jgi:glycosyltransferase involved in cell wall biosynthesis
MKISYGLTVCNEHEELLNLITYLKDRIDSEDEIVVVYDQNRVTDEVLNVLDQYKNDIHSHPFNFQQNFLENKNFMNSKCSGDYIFQIDADEIPEEFLVQNLKTVLELNPVDLLISPRKNLVPGLTPEHIQKWGWIVNEQGWVNWPDCQKRIYKNDLSIKWTGHQVHGMVEGYKTYIELPLQEEWSIIHNKTIDRQEKQNERYTKIDLGQLK